MVYTTTTFMPASTALAGLVPWADLGIKHTFLCPWPVLCRYFMIVKRPAYSPVAPEFGWKLI